MPSSPISGQVIRIQSSYDINSITLSGNAGQTIDNPLSYLKAGTGASYIYVAAYTVWLPLYQPSAVVEGFTASSLTFSSTSGIIGSTTNDSAAAGSVGEYIRADVQYNSSPVSLTSGASANVTSISLTAGDWDVMGMIGFNIAATTVISYAQGGANTASATLPSNNDTFYITPAVPATASYIGLQMAIPTYRISIASTTTVYLVALATFSVSTVSAYGFISARRRR